MSRFLCLMLSLGALTFVGCGAKKLNEEKSFNLTPGERDKIYLFDAQSSEQTIKVAVTSSEAVDLFVFLKNDVADGAALDDNDRKKKALASKIGVTSDTLTAKVPAKQEYSLLVSLSLKSKKADGKVKITN